jgi:hypothetical protein
VSSDTEFFGVVVSLCYGVVTATFIVEICVMNLLLN